MPLKSAKIPSWAHQNASDLQAELVRRGLDALPAELLHPTACPRCGSAVKETKVDALPHVRCTKCSYLQQVPGEEGAGVAHISVGHIVGLGIAALWRELGKQGAPPRREPSGTKPHRTTR